MTRPRPFSFDEFRSAAQAAQTAQPSRAWSEDDVAEARAEGVLEGRRLAMETIAADDAAALARIGEEIARQSAAFERRLAERRTELQAIARLFLEEFCSGLASAREIEVAADLLRRLTEHSEDRRPARLILNADSLERLRSRLESAIDKKGVADFVTLDGDRRLKPGEARIEWRGGEAKRGRAEIAAAVAAILDPMAETEPQE